MSERSDHPFASARAAAEFHISADDLSPDAATEIGAMTSRQRRVLNLFLMVFHLSGMCVALAVIFMAGVLLATVLP